MATERIPPCGGRIILYLDYVNNNILLVILYYSLQDVTRVKDTLSMSVLFLRTTCEPTIISKQVSLIYKIPILSEKWGEDHSTQTFSQ